MVLTRSQADAAERERRDTERRDTERPELELEREEFGRLQELQNIEQERRQRVSLDPPASPNTRPGTENGPGASISAARASPTTAPNLGAVNDPRSPARSVRSRRSTASAAARARLVELEAEEKLAALKKKELEIEANLIRKRLAVDLSAIQDDQESLHEENLSEHHQKVDAWLRTNTLSTQREKREDPKTGTEVERHLRFNVRERSPTPVKSRSDIDALTEAMQKLSRPRVRCPDLQAFSGTPNEWLVFKAAFQDSTKIYQLTPVENIQRLRSCLKGEARELVAALLHTASDPEVIIKTLEQCFGRPEIIIDRALDDLKKLPKPGSSAMELNNFAVKLQNVVCIFKSIGRHGYLYNPMLARETLEKLSPHIRSRWCDYASEHEGTQDPEIVVLSRFLMQEADRALKYSYAPSTNTAARKEYRPAIITAGNKKANAVYNVASDEQIDRCPSCEKTHNLMECPRYKALSVDQRWELVRENKLCFKCIAKKHRRMNCRAKLCDVNRCQRPHHSTLHQQEKSEERQDTPRPPTQTAAASTETVLTVATSAATDRKAVLLKMCPVTVVGPRGEIKTHALLDEGATITLVDEELARSVGAKGSSLPLHMQGVNMSQHENDSKLVTVHLKSADNVLHKLRAHTIKNMKLIRQSIPSALLEHEHLRDLPQDEVCYDSMQPGILVGADHWEYIVSQELRVGEPNQPAASRTQLGWVIHGTVPRGVIKNKDSVLHIYTPEHGVDANEQQNQRFHDLVDHHFRIEALGVAHKIRVSDADLRATKIVEQTKTKKVDKGYEMELPWEDDNVRLPPSHDAVLRRLHKIERYKRTVISELYVVHAAGFTLRGRSYNDNSVLQDVPKKLCAMTPTQLGGDEPENKRLGLHWNAERDELRFNTSMNRVSADVRARIRAHAKRETLSAVISIYEPLGWLSHYTIRAKIILRGRWRLKIPWDEPIPAGKNEPFAAWPRIISGLSCRWLERSYALEQCQDELKRLKTSRPITKARQLFRLDPELEEDILHERGRIGDATAPMKTKRPVILHGRHRTSGPCSETDQRTWRASLALADHFWRRWVREYLPTLIPRGEPTNDKRPIQVGDIVTVVDHTRSRNVWPMGIIERGYERSDGEVRVAYVRNKTCIFKRLVSKLVVLVKEEATRAAPGGELLWTPS